MEHHDQPVSVPLPVGTAALSGLVCFVFIYGAAKPVTILLDAWWAKSLVYFLLPVAVTFAILHRSAWHQERAGTARTGSLLLLSCLIFVSDLLVIGILVAMACLFMGINRGHQ